jgi:hypothetical protein
VSEQQAPSDPGALILPFGKHKGATVAEMLAKGPAYADWVVAGGKRKARRNFGVNSLETGDFSNDAGS